ncbi:MULTISPECIES: GNAT family N-acetyltransferase [Acidiphilium]|uniref:GNAT family N-acetyltransferase n=1 Tax=Acidiphilium TaxID=522 RepID=UPI000970DD98|nr:MULTISPECIES: GNAT family protein [Acidiphilium]
MCRNAYGQIVGAPVPDWTPRPPPPHTPMHGAYCHLEPLDPARHADDLVQGFLAAPDDRDWTWWRTPRPADAAAFHADLARIAAITEFTTFAIIDATNRAVGYAAYMGINPEHGSIEIGAVNYTRALHRSRAGTEAIFLMLSRAFDELAYRRCEWQCHSLNTPSRQAALRLGFQLEGIFRQSHVTQGRNRDTAWHAIIDPEWPAIRAGFLAWLDPANFTANGTQIRSLATCRAAATKTA